AEETDLKGRVEEKSAKPFELNAAHNAREETIAWEQWHKRICKEISHRTEDRALTMAKLMKLRVLSPSLRSGSIEMHVTVTRDRQVSGVVVKANDNPKVVQAMQDAVASLNGDEAIAFPPNSLRESITIDMVFERGPKILPISKWLKTDFEPVLVDEPEMTETRPADSEAEGTSESGYSKKHVPMPSSERAGP
ncbi:MAG TPA: hypothetical protein V6C72_14805, partial [Chroococcales cyanobacterium]